LNNFFYSRWANNLETLQLEDRQRTDLLFESFGTAKDVRSLREAFYKYVNHPLRTICKGKSSNSKNALLNSIRNGRILIIKDRIFAIF
jgi:hypothetical protein